jgi:hypothetical protein
MHGELVEHRQSGLVDCFLLNLAVDLFVVDVVADLLQLVHNRLRGVVGVHVARKELAQKLGHVSLAVQHVFVANRQLAHFAAQNAGTVAHWECKSENKATREKKHIVSIKLED